MKKILITLLLVGCGAQTPEEFVLQDYVKEFTEDCIGVYGDICKEVRIEASVGEGPNVCWTEDGSIKRGLVVSKNLVIDKNRKGIYQEMLNCVVFATNHNVEFSELIEKVR